MDRPSNQNQNDLKQSRKDGPAYTLLSATDYFTTVKTASKDSGLVYSESVYQSLLHYEKQINHLTGYSKLLTFQVRRQAKVKALNKIFNTVKDAPVPLEPLNQQENSQVKAIASQDVYGKQLAEIIEEKVENQKREQQQFIECLKAQIYQDQMRELEGITELARLLQQKITGKYALGFKAIAGDDLQNEATKRALKNPFVIKNIITSTYSLLNNKLKEKKEWTFRTLLKQFGLSSISEQIDANMKFKGKMLMGLKQYPRLNLKRAFWRWYLNSTDTGETLFQRAADNLVLYTNINKTTSFYRLFNKVKGKRRVVHPRVKRMTTMLYLYTKIFYDRQMREFFEKLKLMGVTIKSKLAQNVVDSAKFRQLGMVNIWIKGMKGMRSDLDKQARIKAIQTNFMNRLMKSKIGKVVQAFKAWRGLPERKDNAAFLKASRFEKGLANFVERTVKRALGAFKNEYEQGQASKKRAVIQLIDCTMGGQKKLYSRWKSITEKTRLMNQCRQITSLFQTLNFAIKSVADMAFVDNKDSALKEKALIQLFKNLAGNMSDCFKRWRDVNNIEKLRERMSNQQKENVLKVLNGLLTTGKTAQIRQAINKFRLNRRITEIQRNFLKRLLMSKAGLVVIAFRKIQTLPERKDNAAFLKASRFEKGLANFVERTVKRALGAFKNEYEQGQASKKRAVIQLIDCTMGGQKKLYSRWKSITEKTRLMNQCRQITSLFQTLNFAIKSVADMAFVDNKDSALKEKALIQLFKNLAGNMSDCFKRWRDVNNIEKLRERMSNQQKENVLKVLNGLLTTGKTAQIRQAINKFRLNRRITEIQRNFLKRLLMSKAGLVVIAFRKIQTLPERKDNAAFLKASRFEKGLANFVERTVKRALGAFKNEYEQGQASKKRAVIQLIDCTMGGQKKLYSRWKSITEKTRLMNQCRQITSLFQTLNFAIKSVADMAFVDNKDSALKEKALIQLFKNLAGNMSDCFKRWRDVNNIEKLRERMSNQQKENVLKVLNGLLTTGKTAQIRQAINKFRLNRRITEIQRNFLKRLLMSKAGLVVIAFRKIQTLPERKDNAAFLKASRFEKGLANFVERTVKRALGAFKNEYEQGQASKKRAVIQLIDCTMGGQKKLYSRWKSITEKTRLMNQCRQITSLFQTLNFAIKSVADMAFVDNKDSALKEKALIQLFKNLAGNMSDCFKRWRDVNNIEKLRERMSNQQKENVLKVLNGLLTTGKTAQIRQAINKFRLNRRITEIQRNFLKRLLMSKAGLVVIAFRKIQTLPERKDNAAFLKASRFEKGLANFVERTVKRALGAFKNEYEQGQASKKRAVIQLIDCTMGGQKKLYSRWKSITEKTRLMNQCRQITSLFQTLNFAIKSVADMAFVDNKDSALKEKALIQLFKNLAGNMSDCFKRWRDVNNIEKLRERMSNQQKENVLKVLNGLLTTGKTAQIRQAINKFRLNRRITEIQRNFLKRLLMSKAGLVVIAFRKIQTLPERKDNAAFLKASRFEKGLANFVERTVKRALGAFKNEYEQGQASKKRAVIQLIDCTMGGQKKLYSRWKSITEKTRLMNQCRQITSLFQTLNFAIKSVADMAFVDNKDSALKEKALIQLFKNLAGNMSDCFKRWRDVNNIEKLRERMSNQQKENVLKVLNGLLTTGKTAQIRQAINKFRLNRRITEIQRNFLKRLLMSKAGLVVIAFRKIQTLPERKDNAAFLKASRFEKGLANFVERTVKRALGAFKNEYEQGQASKKRAVIQLIDCTMGGQKKLYSRWKSITEKTRLMNQCRQITSLFQTLNFAIKSVADMAFVDNKDSALKEKALIQLFKNLAGNMSDCFKRWRDVNNIEKLRERMSNQQKENVLKVLNGLLTTGKTAQIRQAINKFRLNRRITEIQRNFLKRLLMSKAGLVVIAFRKIQTLPERKDNAAFLKASRFEKGLANFVERTVKRALGAFKNEYEQGQASKKRAVIQLIDCTMGGQKKLYSRWKSITEKTRLMNQCRQITSLFQTLNFAIKSVADMAFVDNKDSALKEKALIQLFKNLAGNMSDCFKRWRDVNNIEKLRERMSNQQKENVLKVLNGLLTTGKTAQIRQAINKFRLNRRITEIQRNFLKRLLMSKAGLVVIAFRKIQTLPERKDNAAFLKASRFEKGLANFVERTVKRALGAFKNEYEQGQASKKRAVIQLIDCTMGGQKKLYSRWKSITEKTRLMNQCRQITSLFQTLNFAIKSVADMAFVDNKDSALKEKALIQLFKNLAGNMSDCFKRWRDVNNIEKLRERMSNQQKENVLKVLNGLLTTGKTAQIRQAINKFRLNRRITEIQRNFLKRLLMSKAGLVVIAFRKIQTLPERKDNAAFLKASRFEKGLANFVERTVKRALGAFKNEYEQGQASKKRAVIQLIDCTMGGQKKLYSRWKSITEKTRLMNQCRQITSLFQTLNFAIKSVADMAFVDNKDSALKEKALIQLFKNLAGNMSDCFKRWRDVNNIEKLRERMSNQQKENVLKVLNGLLTTGKTAQIRQAINKFRLNRRITEIQRNFLKRLLMSKAGLVVIAFRKIQTLPERKDNAAFLKASRFEKGLANFVERTVKRALGAFKNEYEQGQASKKRAVIQLIDCTMGGQKKLYSRWKSITEKTRLMNQCRQITSLFQTLNFAIKSVADMAFVDNKDSALKEKALIQLFKNLAGNMSDCFKRWRDVNNIEKLRERMSNQQKENVLKVLNGLLTTGKTAQIRQAINKFRLNRRITEIQRNFLKRLLMSKAGLVVIAFRKIQTLPERKDNAAFLKASRFEKGLANFVERTVKRALGAFKNEYEQGQASKKRAVIQLIDCTMGGQKKLYSRWKSITEKTRLMNQCRQITSLFQTLNFAIKSVADMAFVDNKDSALKEKALIQLFKNLAGNMSDCFKRWRDVNNIEKLRERMSNQQKENVLKVLNGLLTTGKTAQIRQAINKFRLNRRITEIQRNFLKRLLMSKAGLVVIAFRKIQTLPERKDNAAFLKASRFEKGLANFVERTVKRALGAFKNEYEQGQASKKRAVIQLIDCTMGGQKKLYSRWKSITEKTRLMNQCRQITSLFQTLNFAIKSVADMAFVDNKDSALKEKALIQLFKNLAGNMSDCFKRWRDVNNIEKLRERMSNQQKENVLKVLNGLLTTGKTAQIRQAINKFRLNRRITEIQRNFLKRLLMSKAGLVVIAFRKIQTLPERKDNAAFLKASRFEKGLANFVERTVKRALGAFKNEYEQGQASKKRAVIQLIDCTMGGQKKLYSRWKSITEKTRLMNQCRQITSLFQTLNFAIKSVADMAFVDNKDSALKEKALIQLFKNLAGNMSDCFKRWRDVNNIEKLRERMSNQQKENVLKVLNGLLTTGKTAQIRQAINKFRLNRRITEIQRNFLKRLLMSKAGLVVIAFRKIQTLPERKDNAAFLKASRFEKGLANFVERTVKRALGAFKNEYEQGQASKKRAVIQLIDCTMGGQKKLYSRWKSITEKTRLMNQCRQITSLFQTLNFAIKSVADMAFVDNKDSALKEKALIQLFKNLAGNMSDCFKRWRDVNNIEKLRERMSNQQKENVLKVLNGLLTTGKTAQIRQAINKFRLNRRITEIQRNFLKRLLMSKAGLVVIAFRKIQTLPERKDNAAFLKASRFEKGLANFVERTVKRALGAFKNEYEQGQASKKRAVIQLIDCTMGGQKKLYTRWLNIVKNNKLYQRCKLLSILFQNTHKAANRNFTPIFFKKQYGMQGISKLHKYFTKICENTNENMKTCIRTMKSYAEQQKINPWFKKAATILSLNTKINIQKSFWRMKYNMNTSGVKYNAAIIVKIKKMFNNIRKYYELNMFRSFLMIDKYGKSQQDNSFSRSRNTSDFISPSTQIRHPDDSVLDQLNRAQASNPKLESLVKTTSLNIMDRIFKRNLTRQVRKWQYNAQPERKLQYVHTDLAKKSKQEYQIVAKVGAVDSIRKLSQQALYKAKTKAFKLIQLNMFNKRSENDYDQSLEERLELINRQNNLMEEIRTYKEETQALQSQVDVKERSLREANETVTILSLRINYMITQKFINMIEKVWQGIQYRHMNDAFDGLIDQANRNYEQEQQHGQYQDI